MACKRSAVRTRLAPPIYKMKFSIILIVAGLIFWISIFLFQSFQSCWQIKLQFEMTLTKQNRTGQEMESLSYQWRILNGQTPSSLESICPSIALTRNTSPNQSVCLWKLFIKTLEILCLSSSELFYTEPPLVSILWASWRGLNLIWCVDGESNSEEIGKIMLNKNLF